MINDSNILVIITYTIVSHPPLKRLGYKRQKREDCISAYLSVRLLALPMGQISNSRPRLEVI